MDEIAASLGISKRTLNEVFPDKETLLEECILKSQKDGDIFVKGVIETSSNVLEVLLRCYQWSIERFHALFEEVHCIFRAPVPIVLHQLISLGIFLDILEKLLVRGMKTLYAPLITSQQME